MIRKLFFTLIVACFTILNTYAQSLQDNIPKDVTFVFTINPAVLNSKVKFEKLKEYDFFKMGMSELYKQADPIGEELKKFLNNPKEYGMDLMASSYAFGKIEGENIRMGFMFEIDDIAKINELVKDYIEPAHPIHTAGNLKYITKDGVNMSWNNDQVLISTVKLEYENEEEFDAHNVREEAESNIWMNTVMSPKELPSIKALPAFKMAKVDQDDMNLWMNYESLMDLSNNMQGGGLDPMTKMFQDMTAEMYKDSYISMGLNFDQGATKLNTRYFMNEELTEMYRKVTDVTYNKNFLKYIPENNLGYFSFNFNLKNLIDIFKSSENELSEQMPVYESIAIQGLKEMGVDMTAEEVYNLWKGDAMFVVTGVKEFEKEIITYEYDDDFNKTEVKQMKKEQLPEFIFMMSHGSKDNVLKLIDLGKQSSMISENKGLFQLNVPDMPMDVFMKVENDMILVSNINDVVTKKAKKVFKKKELISAKEASEIMKSAQRIYWNIPATMNVLSEMEDMNLDNSQEMVFNMSKDSFESLVIDMNKNIGSAVEANFILNFNNKEMNSLEQIFSMINSVFSTMTGGSSM